MKFLVNYRWFQPLVKDDVEQRTTFFMDEFKIYEEVFKFLKEAHRSTTNESSNEVAMDLDENLPNPAKIEPGMTCT